MTEYDIQIALIRHFHTHRNHLLNAYVFDNESDYFSMTRSGFVHECEVKLTKGDFKADFKKDRFNYYGNIVKGYIIDRWPYHGYMKKINGVYENISCNVRFRKVKNHVPNYFLYVCPEGVINPDEVNPKTGLYHAYERRGYKFVKPVKKPGKLHNWKYDNFNYLCEKFYYKYVRIMLDNYGTNRTT